MSAPRLLPILDPLGKGVAEDSLSAACRIGRLYLAAHPEDGDIAVLEHALFGNTGFDDRRAAQAWDVACREDYRAERLVAIEGWWLARSEARLCALLHLRDKAEA